MHDTIQILQTGKSQAQFFSEWRGFKISMHDTIQILQTGISEWRGFENSLTKKYDNLPTANHMSFIIRNWDNLDCLNEKFDELREKEINNTISEFEKSLLKDVLKKRILDFPNPYLPSDHKEAIEMSRKYGILK